MREAGNASGRAARSAAWSDQSAVVETASRGRNGWHEKDWLETVMDLLVAEGGNIGTIYFLMNEDNVKLVLNSRG